jgi:hypothetical protein
MATLSPQFSFAEYWTYNIAPGGQIAAPTPSKDNDYCYDKFIYVFQESGSNLASPGSQWRHYETYKLEPPPSVSRTGAPYIRRATGTGSGGELTWGPAEDAVQLLISDNCDHFNIHYFFLVSRWPLLPKTIAALESRIPADLPLSSLAPNSPHFRYVVDGAHGKAVVTVPSNADAKLCQFVVDPYSIAEHLAQTAEWRFNRVSKYVLPEACETDDERNLARFRVQRYQLALEIDALRRAGLDIDSKLRDGSQSGLTLLDQVLRDMDPRRSDGELGKFIQEKEDIARALIYWTSTPLWELLYQDAIDSDERAGRYFGTHLKVTAQCLSRVPETVAGEALFTNLYEKNLRGTGARPTPTSSTEFIAQRFVFAEPRTASNWEESAASQAARSLFALHMDTAKVMAKYALDRLSDYTVLVPDQALQSWAQIPTANAMGYTAYRWAYYLRNDFEIQSVTINGQQRLAVYTYNGQKQLTVLDLDVNWDSAEWRSRLGSNTIEVPILGAALSVIGVVFATGALAESLETNRNVPLSGLKAASAYMSLAADPLVERYFSRLATLSTGGRALAVARWVGFAGFGLGAFVLGWEARNSWIDDGECDVALAQSATAIGAGIVAWATFASAFSVTGPAGWAIIAGYGLIVGGSLTAAWLRDTPIENVVEHTYFGRQQGDAHNAPPMALCAGRAFGVWQGEALTTLQAQQCAILNYGWAFVVQGDRFIEGYPLVRISPQRLSPQSYMDAEVTIQWRDRSTLAERQCRCMVRLHIGNNTNLRITQQTGEALELIGIASGGVTLSAISRVRQNGRQYIDWIVAPPAMVRDDTAALELRSIQLRLRLFAFGNTPPTFGANRGRSLLIPMPEPGTTYMFLDYELVRPSVNRGLIRPILNDEVVSSLEAYPA